ncbi:concanavalin A-like lectin/glucanase domain-containing protein [Mariannaea sp. PMI_226]|nr:concanavalin A-like lectin/glucanase domain-containing protein [Mariannaea sp. PMI_226]
MTVRFLVNFVLLALPIGITLGVLLGIDQQRRASGQEPLYQPGDGSGNGNGGGSGKPPKKGNGISHDIYCDKTFGYTPYTAGQQYTLNPNQWGWEKGDDGALCLSVSTFNNGTYSSKSTAPEWSVTWQYPQGPETQPVHAYPNIKLDGKLFPEKLSTIKSIDVDFKWSYGVGDNATATTDETKLNAVNLNTNVAMDMFLDSDKSKAGDAETASHEVMVWFAAIGPATQPIGLTVGGVRQTATTNVSIGGTNFGLFTGNNSNNQVVLTWMASDTADSFNGDVYPLIEKLLKMDQADFPTEDYYMGYMSWGSEAYSSTKNVTFNVPKLSIDLGT